jgi:hypothetical protein
VNYQSSERSQPVQWKQVAWNRYGKGTCTLNNVHTRTQKEKKTWRTEAQRYTVLSSRSVRNMASVNGCKITRWPVRLLLVKKRLPWRNWSEPKPTSRRHSVYRIAAGGSASTEPKFPCPWTSGYLIEKSCKIA